MGRSELVLQAMIMPAIPPILLRIREARLRKHYSQDYMALKLDIGQNCYSKLELGKTRLTTDRLLHICEILELDVRELFLTGPAG